MSFVCEYVWYHFGVWVLGMKPMTAYKLSPAPGECFASCVLLPPCRGHGDQLLPAVRILCWEVMTVILTQPTITLQRVLMRNISLVSIDVGRRSPLWVTLFPRQSVLSSMRGGSQLRANKDPCVFPSLLGPWMCPTALSSCLDFPCNYRLYLELWANETLLPRAAFSQGIYHSNRNEAKTNAQGVTHTGSQTLLTPPCPECHHQCSPSVPNRGESRELWYPSYILLQEISEGESGLISPSLRRQKIPPVTGSHSSETMDTLWSNLIS